MSKPKIKKTATVKVRSEALEELQALSHRLAGVTALMRDSNMPCELAAPLLEPVSERLSAMLFENDEALNLDQLSDEIEQGGDA